MLARLNHIQLLRYSGLFTWAVVGVPLLYLWMLPLAAGVDEVPLGLRPRPWQGWVAYAAFGISYAWLTRGLDVRRRTVGDYVLLLVLTGAAISVSYYAESGLGSVLLMVAACLLPWLLPLPLGIAWLALSQLAVVPVFVRGFDFTLLEAMMQSVLYAGFSLFVFVTSLVARQQAQARDEQRRLNAELRATRALLGESVRVNERTRISRELHDLLGHHLTALSLNLEVAGHLAEGRVKDHVHQAHTLARLLLTDVREAVSQLREGGSIDLAAALRPLAENVPALDIHMDIQAPLMLDDPERAHVLLRCTQEIITNTVRHAGARNLWIRAERIRDCVRVTARDDGRGAEQLTAGNGLRGMRERLAQYGGDLTIDTRPDAGFSLTLTLPVSASTAACEGVTV
ncbi:histidine kinase [Lysobacter korlensis]|uniref:Histidine kinase n=1 Tax=Lysobacter korlensis TaxID=553636 RepID=A0ABV6RKD7_9GAMM